MPFTGRSADHVWAIDYFLAVWFVLAGLSTAWVAWDQFRHNPEPAVMTWGVSFWLRAGRPCDPAQHP